jgi:hypothetical protein
MRTLIGLFLVTHGLVTALIWGSPKAAVAEGQWQPPDPMHSWLLGDARALSIVLGLIVGMSLAITGFGFLTHQTWWPVVGVAAGASSLFLFTLFFTPWWLAGIAISSALIIGAARIGVVS